MRHALTVSRTQRASKAGRLCYFCGLPGCITKEHVWPQWLNDGVDVERTRSARTLGFGRTAHDAFTEFPTLNVTKQGSVFTSKVREVCRTCNNEWMSRLETAAKPLLRRLWAPSYPLGRTSLSPDEATAVATWATKTAWMHERASNPDPTPTPEMRSYLKDSQMPPQFTRVWVGRYVGQMNFGARFARLGLNQQDHAWDSAERRHVLMCAMAFNRLAMIVRTDDGWGVPQIELSDAVWRPLWPITKSVQWPPPQTLTDQHVTNVVTQFSGWLRLPNLPIFNRDAERDSLG